MGLKAVVARLEDVNEAQRPLYKEMKTDTGSMFILDVEETNGFALQDFQGLKSALGKERQNVGTLQAELAKFAGMDPAKAKEALAKWQEIVNFDPEKKVAVAMAEKEKALQQRFADEKKALEEEIGSVTGQLKNTLVTDQARAAISKFKGNVELLLPHVVSRIDMQRDPTSKKFVARVIGDDGNPVIADSAGNFQTIEQFVEGLSKNKSYQVAFDSRGSSGSGEAGRGRAGGGTQPSTVTRDQLTNLTPDQFKAIQEGKLQVTDD